MTRAPETVPCRDCGTRIVFARRPWPNQDRTGVYEAADQTPFSDAAVGSHVILAGQAWRPTDLIEDFRTRFECDEDRARALVEGHPWRRPHFCQQTTTTEDDR